MMRRARAFLPPLAFVLPLAVAACGGESIPPAPGPAHQSPTATVTPSAHPTATPTAVATPTATAVSTPVPTPGVTPSPTPPPAATPTPTPGPHGIEFTPITRGEPLPLPEGIALYYRVGPCTSCGFGFGDLRRILFDEAAGRYLEDRPLVFFDVKGMVESAAISHSGQEMAAAICSAGLCELGVGHPSADAAEHVWVSRDAGSTWSHAGEVLPGAWILEVTETDVLVREWNLWGRRETLGDLTDAEWEEMRARLSHLVPDEREGWESRFRWVVSGEAYVPPTAPSPPALGNVSWRPADRCSDGALPWTAEAQGDRLLALVDEKGAVRRVYGTSEPLWASEPGGATIRETPSCAVGGVLVQEIRSYGAHMEYTAGVAFFDLESGSVHDVDGLSLPEGFDPETDGPQEEYYHFWTARPAPAPAETRQPAIEYTPLTMGEPRALPVGTALYFGGPGGFRLGHRAPYPRTR